MTPLIGMPRLHLMTLAMRAAPRDSGKPIYGSSFDGKCLLVRGRKSPSGLVRPMSYVMDADTGMALGMGDGDAAALADARLTLERCTPTEIAEFIKAKEAEWARKPKERTPSIKSRRRAIFDASEGACHYCAAELSFSGPWHVEHRQPKSRGGSDESLNLAAACGLCNLRKKDMTEAEFCAKYGLDDKTGRAPARVYEMPRNKK